MKHTITLNVLDARGHNTPVRASVEVKDLARPVAIKTALEYIERLGIKAVPVPSSVRSSGATRAAMRRTKVSLPRL